MKNPVQKLINAGSKMKHNPPLAQREANSPNKINAFAAQMVIPEQQAMQKSKPIPNPVGSVLMQKLAQAQQAAMASRMPQPSEGGIAQMAAKGGVLKFAGAGKVPKGKKAATTKVTPKRTTKRAAPAATPAEVFPPLYTPTEALNPDVPMDSMTRRLSESSVASKHARDTGANPVEPKKGYSLSADPIAEIKESLDKALNKYRNGTKTKGADAQKFLNDLDKLNPSDRAKYADFEEHLHRVNPSEGGPRNVPEKIPGETSTQFLQRVRSEGRQADVPPKLADTIAEATKVETPKLGSLHQMQGVETAFRQGNLGKGIEQFTNLQAQNEANKLQQEANTRTTPAKIKKEVQGIRRLGKSTAVSPQLQNKRDILADKARRNAHPSRLTNFPLTEEEIPQALAEKFGRDKAKLTYERAKADISQNVGEFNKLNELGKTELSERQKREASANALKTQEGRNVLPAKGVSKDVPVDVANRIIQGRADAARTKTLEGRRQIAEEQGEIRKGVNAKSSIIGEKGQVVPRKPSGYTTLKQEAERDKAASNRKARRARVSSALGLPEETGIASAASPEARAYMADMAERKKELDKLANKEPSEVKTEGTKLPSKKAKDVSQGEATSRLQKAKAEGQAARGETPATLHSKIEGITEGAIHSDPEMLDEVTRLSSEFKANNPDATTEQMGSHIMDNVPEGMRAKFMAKAGPLLERYGIKAGKALGAIGAYESAANIGNVAIDPTKSKTDVVRAAGHEAVGAIPALTGAAIGSGAGSLVAPGPGTVIGGLAGGIAGAVGGDPAVSWLKEKMGMDQEGPQATAQHTIPTVGDVASKVSEQFSGDNWSKSPAQRFKDEVAAMPEDEETLRLERMGRGEMSLPEIARSAPESAPVIDRTTMSRPGAIVGPAPQSRSSAPVATGGAGAQAPAVKPTLTSAQQEGGIATSPDAPKLPNQQQDMYAGDTSEGTPEGAVQELMKLRGPGYQYSPEVMGMLKDAKEEQQGATLLSMLAQTGAGLANRDRYAGAHDAALLANQAFTSGREREEQAQQQFLQGIIHNEQVPYEMRQHAADTYAKMEMAKAQNAALYGRALLNSDTRRYGYDRQAESRTAAQRDQYAKLFVNSTQKEIGQLQRQLATDFNLTDEQKQDISSRIENLSQQVAMARSNMTDQSPVLTGIAGDEGLGQTSEPRLKLDAFN